MSQRAYSFTAAAVHDAIELGDFDGDHDEVVTAHCLWAHVHGAASLALSGRLGFLPEDKRDEFFDACVDTAIRGFLSSGKSG